MSNVKKNDWVEIQYTGFANGVMFDSNNPSDISKLHAEAKARKTLICVGSGMVVKGLDHALEGKELNKKYKISIKPIDGFGTRNVSLIKTIPVKQFLSQKVMPYPGLTVILDNNLAKVVAVSGARVITDFNNPLAGKDLEYDVTITRHVTDLREISEAFFEFFLKFVPEFTVSDNVTIKGPKPLEYALELVGEKFKSLVGKSLKFELSETAKNPVMEQKPTPEGQQ